MRFARLRAWLASIRLRVLFRTIFALLAFATVALALAVLREEKQQSFDNYRETFNKTADQIAARLRHPTGQLALLNPEAGNAGAAPLRPLLLPWAALDFDDPTKVRNAIEMSGCLVQYTDDASMCVAVGAQHWAGAFVYIAGSLKAPVLVPHHAGERDLSLAHRMRVQLDVRGMQYAWIAPVEWQGAAGKGAQRGRLTGFVERESEDYERARPQRDFNGWIWQENTCAAEAADCTGEVFYSLRVPVAVLAEALSSGSLHQWPPADLGEMFVHVRLLAPGHDAVIFDSDRNVGRPAFVLDDLRSLLLPGESLVIRKAGAPERAPDVMHMVGSEDSSDPVSPMLAGLIRRLPVDSGELRLTSQERIKTPLGNYDLQLSGDVRTANRILARTATRVSWFVGGMLLAIAIAWLIIELGIIRPIALLTRRTRSVRQASSLEQGLAQFDVSDLRSGDELGILATNLHELQARVREDMAREKIRAVQEKDMWHAVGHEIMSPLQSLLVLHPQEADGSRRYLLRMRQAIRVLYGSASPTEAFERSDVRVDVLDLDAFLQAVADNAPSAGIHDVRYTSAGAAVLVRADEFPLEDVVTHVLKNAERHRTTGTAITITLEQVDEVVRVRIHNEGSRIAEEMLDKIFEYGVSDQPEAAERGNRGQGLFVARTYMAKMGGTIMASNEDGGVSFILSLLPAKELA